MSSEESQSRMYQGYLSDLGESRAAEIAASETPDANRRELLLRYHSKEILQFMSLTAYLTALVMLARGAIGTSSWIQAGLLCLITLLFGAALSLVSNRVFSWDMVPTRGEP